MSDDYMICGMVLVFILIILMAAVIVPCMEKRKMDRIRKEYLQSLQNDDDDYELEDFIYDVEAGNQKIIYYHDKIQ